MEMTCFEYRAGKVLVWGSGLSRKSGAAHTACFKQSFLEGNFFNDQAFYFGALPEPLVGVCARRCSAVS